MANKKVKIKKIRPSAAAFPAMSFTPIPNV